jgi:ferredoxin
MNVYVDEVKCVGSGQCVLIAPAVFDQRDEDGIVVLVDDSPPAGELDDVREAVVVCPAAAIRLSES